jgi:hypothetical protein
VSLKAQVSESRWEFDDCCSFLGMREVLTHPGALAVFAHFAILAIPGNPKLDC